MSPTRWTVVIPTYRRHDTLAACLERLAPGSQALDAAAYEVIVSDDARSPATRAFLAARFPWVRWIAGPARGPAANRNAAAAAARSPWLAFTDDDTLPSREWLAAYDRAVGADPESDALEGRTTCPGGFGTPMHYAPVNETGGRFWSCNVAVRAERFRAVGGFDEGFIVPHMEDQDLRERLTAAGVAIRWVPEAHVEHPPRRQPDGRRLGFLRAAEVRYLHKHGAARPVRWQLLRRIVRMRIGIIADFRLTADSILALRSLLLETWTVWRHGAGWERDAAREFPAAGAAAPAAPPWLRRDAGASPFPAQPLDRADGAPSLSVIVPTFARPDSLHRCLAALAAQRRAPDEVIVVVRETDRASRDAAHTAPLPEGCARVILHVGEGGVAAALQRGLEASRGAIVAFTDDDAEPRTDWTERLLAVLASDRGIGGVGGRDWQPSERGSAPVVGRVRWTGRVVGRHHLGAGPAREVDVLKGVNCAFRAPLARAIGIDQRLRGAGAQVHWELGLCLPMRRAGWRLIYDPAIAVEHHVAPRASDDQVHRGIFAAGPYADAAYNEARALARHLGGLRWGVHRLWAALIGTTASPGLGAALRLALQRRPWAREAWRAARRARAEAARERVALVDGGPWIPVPGSLP